MKSLVIFLVLMVVATLVTSQATNAAVQCSGKTCGPKEACMIKFGPYRPEACYPVGTANSKCDDLEPIEGKYKMNPPCGSGLKCIAMNTRSHGPRNKRCQKA